MCDCAHRIKYYTDPVFEKAAREGSSLPAMPVQRTSEPVAMRHSWDGDGYQYIDSGSGSDWKTRHKDAEPLYAMPVQRTLGEDIEKELNDIEGLCAWGREKNAIRFYAQIQGRVGSIRNLLSAGVINGGEDAAAWRGISDGKQIVIDKLEAENRILREGLNACASWGEGETVGSHFDEPGAASHAREYLAAADNLQKHPASLSPLVPDEAQTASMNQHAAPSDVTDGGDNLQNTGKGGE